MSICRGKFQLIATNILYIDHSKDDWSLLSIFSPSVQCSCIHLNKQDKMAGAKRGLSLIYVHLLKSERSKEILTRASSPRSFFLPRSWPILNISFLAWDEASILYTNLSFILIFFLFPNQLPRSLSLLLLSFALSSLCGFGKY